MKILRHFFSVFILLSFISCNDTELNEPVESENYFKLYGGFNDDFVCAVKQNNNDGLLIAGYSQYESGFTWAYVSKTLATGLLDWDTVFATNKNSKAYDIYNIQDRNQMFVACGQEYNEDSTWVYLLDFSIEGVLNDSISTKIVASKVQSVQIYYQNDGSVRLISQIIRTDPDTKKNYGFLLIHELTDDLRLEQVFSIELNQQVAGSVLVKYITEQKVYLAATVYETEKTEDNSPPTDIRLLLVNNNAVEWNYLYGKEGVSESCSDIMISSNSVVIAGNYRESTEAIQKINLLTMNLNGIEQNNYQIEVAGNTSDISCSSFTLNDSGNYVFCGEIVTQVDKNDILFLETDTEGKNVRSEFYGSHGETKGLNHGKSIHYLPEENAYLLTGEMETINNYDICIFKLDDKGKWISTE